MVGKDTRSDDSWFSAPPDSSRGGAGSEESRGWDLRPTDLKPESADPLLGALLALCRLHGRPRSAASLTAGLPLENNRLTPHLFPVAAERARLSARLVRRPFADIPHHLYPVVLLMKGRTTYVVLREVRRDQFEVLLPETGTGTEILSRAAIEARYEGYAILARPEVTYRGQSDDRVEPPKGDWFWSTLRRMGRVYAYVILAAIMVNLFALAGPLFTMNVYDRVVPNQALETLWVLASGVVIVYAFDFVLRLIRAYLIDHTGKRADVVMSSIIFGHALNVRMGARPASSGAFANKLKEFEAVRDFFASATVVALVDIPFIFLFIAVIYWIAGPAAYVPLLAVPVVIIGGLLLQAPLRRAVQRTNERNSQKHGILVEVISSLETIKSLGAEGRMQRDWEAFTGESASLGARVKFLSGLGVHFADFVRHIVTVSVIIIGVYQISNNAMTMGALIAATILTGRIMAPLGQVAGLVARLHHAFSARKSIDEIMALPVDRPAGKQFLSRPALAGRIDFRNVTFFYPNTQTPALKDVTFTVGPGERVAIMGPIGSGKSTVARLLTRLYDPGEGSIQIDGADIQQIDPADIRRTAGVVLQDVVLFTGTVRDNIAMGAPEADDQMILRAAELSGAHEFISRHPLGYDMPVGERGSLLSGGQRQAVALARALLPDPPILVLDEPTSMMDIPTEEAFVERLGTALKEKALIIITHRPSLLSIADRLLVLRKGEAIADGPVNEVLPKLLPKGAVSGRGLPPARTLKAHIERGDLAAAGKTKSGEAKAGDTRTDDAKAADSAGKTVKTAKSAKTAKKAKTDSDTAEKAARPSRPPAPPRPEKPAAQSATHRVRAANDGHDAGPRPGSAPMVPPAQTPEPPAAAAPPRAVERTPEPATTEAPAPAATAGAATGETPPKSIRRPLTVPLRAGRQPADEPPPAPVDAPAASAEERPDPTAPAALTAHGDAKSERPVLRTPPAAAGPAPTRPVSAPGLRTAPPRPTLVRTPAPPAPPVDRAPAAVLQEDGDRANTRGGPADAPTATTPSSTGPTAAPTAVPETAPEATPEPASERSAVRATARAAAERRPEPAARQPETAARTAPSAGTRPASRLEDPQRLSSRVTAPPDSLAWRTAAPPKPPAAAPSNGKTRPRKAAMVAMRRRPGEVLAPSAPPRPKLAVAANLPASAEETTRPKAEGGRPGRASGLRPIPAQGRRPDAGPDSSGPTASYGRNRGGSR
ncbi:type I secretion system LssB family ATPase [Roseospira goensis]|uniref:Type I secretion system LssB family ATPase n=2 Tax=Roseospira goensis TaxID=391922 RepID=A0A7W6RY95_9PROT|nr:type I secretion system LssB family ATPase [Roseospira goensis]